ncbi:hypothetical protein NSB1T_03610 [Coprobacter fastidiosus NSB1 = JCM 33896]|nr:hypothetical protein NSB1T_03610 [Coprobacter fastidiosus NSB1 = JCM 33896]
MTNILQIYDNVIKNNSYFKFVSRIFDCFIIVILLELEENIWLFIWGWSTNAS